MLKWSKRYINCAKWKEDVIALIFKREYSFSKHTYVCVIQDLSKIVHWKLRKVLVIQISIPSLHRPLLVVIPFSIVCEFQQQHTTLTLSWIPWEKQKNSYFPHYYFHFEQLQESLWILHGIIFKIEGNTWIKTIKVPVRHLNREKICILLLEPKYTRTDACETLKITWYGRVW